MTELMYNEVEGKNTVETLLETAAIKATDYSRKVTTGFAEEFFKKEEHDYNNFFKPAGVFSTESITEISDKIKKLKKTLAEHENQLTKELAKKYEGTYDQVSAVNIGQYQDKDGDYHSFMIPSGQTVNPNVYKKANIINLGTLHGDICVIEGYCYAEGSIIFKYYSYSISAKKDKCNFTLLGEALFPFLDRNKYISSGFSSYSRANIVFSGTTRPSMNSIWSGLEKINAGEFINNMFGTDRKLDFSLYQVYIFYQANKSFEIILKTAPDELLNLMLPEPYKEAEPVYKLLGVSKETYNEAAERGLLIGLYEIHDILNNRETFNINEKSLLDLLEEDKRFEEELDFYSIGKYSNCYYYYSTKPIKYGRHSEQYAGLKAILDNYNYEPLFRKNYSLKKFARYVINETINQGYSGLQNFLTDLRDYLRMCDGSGITPCLYTSMLKMSHDIATRNHRISISAEDEKKFIDRYSDFKDYKCKKAENNNFMILSPDSTKMVKEEGDKLNHCVASYIKRIIDGDCLILFLRDKSDLTESLVTLEVKDGQIIQARGMSNRQPNEKELSAIKEFAEERELEINY